MLLKLVYHSEMPPLDLEANKGFDVVEIKAILRQLEELGVSNEIIITSTLAEDQLSNLYIHAVMPAVVKKYHVRQVFGSKRNSGFLFGKGVPALLVYGPGEQYPSDVYPHRNGERVITIKDFLEDLLTKLKRGSTATERCEASSVLVKRMDDLRKKIGPIGVPVSDLVREGRRR